MAELEYFTVVSNGIGAIQVDYVDPGTDPDEEKVYAFVDFVPREVPGTVHWLDGLTVPRGIQLDPVRGRYSSEDGKLRTIIGHPTNEKQKVTATGTPITLSYLGIPSSSFANTATPAQVQAALEAVSSIGAGNVYVSGTIANEKQTVTVGGGATGGTFPLALGGPPSDPISRNASASSMQAYLQALDEIGSDGCSVTGPTGGPWQVEFTGVLAGVNVPALTCPSTAGLTPSGTVTITTTVQGSTGTPWTVNFIGALAATNVAMLTATNATVSTVTEGTGDLGVKLVANTPVMQIPADENLIYDVVITVPDLDPLKEDRVVNPFAIAAPTAGGVVIDLADATYHLPPKPAGWP
jgi:hypothetical protein